MRFTGDNFRVLDWVIHSLSFAAPKPLFVCGYRSDTIRVHYPDISFAFNQEWETTHAAWSLLLALPENDSECVVSYADILFRQSTAQQLMRLSADVVVVVDSCWRTRYSDREWSDLIRCEKACLVGKTVTRLGADLSVQLASAEFIGLVRLSARAVACLHRLSEEQVNTTFLRQANLSDVVELLRVQGLHVVAVDVKGDWAELNETADLARFVLGTKAQTLSRLRGMINNARIEVQVSFSVLAWQENANYWVSLIQQMDCSRVIVRSSAFSEDGFSYSNAGAYSSLLNVGSDDPVILRQAIDKVIASYPDGNPANEVLVQPMLNNVLVSGVALTRTLVSGAPYYVANYDDASGSTESITSGSSKGHRTLVIRRDADVESTAIPPQLKTLLPALREIESLLGYDSLDVEFAVTDEGGLHILQVRPIAVDHSGWSDRDAQLYELLSAAEERFLEKQHSSPFVQGARTIFGVMPDWNPAEIIGTKPRQLAISLYRDLIMDETWAIQRAQYGYRDVRPSPLLHVFAGHPYVDVRASLNSFIPVQLSDVLAGRIVDFCLQWLENHPHFHDKLEFDVIPTCFSLDFERWEQRFGTEAGLSAAELEQWRTELLAITQNAMSRNGDELATIEQLQQRRDALGDARLPPLAKSFALLDDARRYGALPFAHLARSSFVAVTLLRSAVSTGVLLQAEMDDFLSSVHTVSRDFTDDALACAQGTLGWSTFVARYGHLRPGTYDITSPCYRLDTERYLRPAVNRSMGEFSSATTADVGTLWQGARERFALALKDAGLECTADSLECFLYEAIEGREYAKFVFTQNLSLALDALHEWADVVGIPIKQIAQVDIDDLRAIGSGQIVIDDVANWVAQQTKSVSAQRVVVEAIELPPLLCRQSDFAVFQYPATQANFVGRSSVVAECVNLELADENAELSGCIVMIRQADPGFDWLFGRHIAGLITMYGGANSHMAIRAAEFGLSAAIGIGEVRYRNLADAKELELDPVNRLITVLH